MSPPVAPHSTGSNSPISSVPGSPHSHISIVSASVQGSHPSQSHSPGSASVSSKSSSHHPQSTSVNSEQPSSSSAGHQSAESAHDERGRNPATGMRPSAPGLIMEGLTLRERIGRFYNDFSSRVPSSVNSGNEADVSAPLSKVASPPSSTGRISSVPSLPGDIVIDDQSSRVSNRG